MLFFKLIFGLTAIVVLSVIFAVAYFMTKLRNMAERFSGGARSAGNAQSRHTGNTRRRSAEYEGGTVVEEEIYDERSRKEAEKKIFPKDEGEYVDYEDVK